MAAAEQKKSYQVVKQFKGLNTKANRTAIDEAEFSWVENAQPIGYANLKVVPNSSNVSIANSVVTFSNTVTVLSSVNIGIKDYVIAFLSDGSSQYYNVTDNTKGNVAVAGTFSGTGVESTQWYNDRMLILDPDKGYFSWDGNNVVSIGSVGSIGIVNRGSGYTSAPTVIISAPTQAGGTNANATATLTAGGANTVASVSLSNAGSGYINAANTTVSFVGGGGSGATAVASLVTFSTGTVSVNVVDGGAGYTNAANTVISFTGGGGTGAAAQAIVTGNVVTQVIMTNPGTGYTNTANLVVTISGGGASNNAVLQGTVQTQQNVSIATFSGRVWIAQGRTVYYSAAGSYTDFTSVSAGAVTLTDSTLHGNIQYLLSANNFLYIFGDDSINVFSDVRVTTSGTTLFTNTNVSASVGSKRPYAIFPYFRSVLFMNDYGVYALVGSTTSKLSDSLDGMFPNIDFNSPIYAGQVLINNILCAAFNFRYYDAVFTQSYRYIQAVFFEKKWFITSQGNSLAYITSVPVGGKITLYGTSNNQLYKLYNDSTSSITSRVQTALMPMGDPIRTKQALKIGVEATAGANSTVTMSATVDNENRSSNPYTLSSVIAWQNNSLQTIGWSNNSGNTIGWGTSGYALYKTDAQQYGKYLGITVTSSNPNFVLNGFEFEHELRVRF
jgi:hypothetical protein